MDEETNDDPAPAPSPPAPEPPAVPMKSDEAWTDEVFRNLVLSPPKPRDTKE